MARAAPDDPVLADDQWARVAETIMQQTGLARSGDDEAVRWIAVRHASDHIHIVATLARQDGTKPRIWNDFYRVREGCQAMERRYGLRVTAAGDRTAGRGPTRGETEHARRLGWEEPARIVLRRAVHMAAAGASSEAEFFARLETAGILVRRRYSQRDLEHVTGYAVARPGHLNRDGSPVWYGGGKLAADLTVPKLHARWLTAGSDVRRRSRPGVGLTDAEQRAVWDGASGAVALATRTIRAHAVNDPAAATDAAWAASDALHIAASVLGSRALRQAADNYSRAARHGYGRIPRPTPAGDRLRASARLLAISATRDGQDQAAAVLVARLVRLVLAVAELRDVQRHAGQAAAARAAVECLHEEVGAARASGASATAQRPQYPARLDFPEGAKPPTRRAGSPPTPVQTPARHLSPHRPRHGPGSKSAR